MSITREERTEKLKGDLADEQRLDVTLTSGDAPHIVPLDQQPEINDGREPVNTETSILRRLDTLETRDMNGELDKPQRDIWDKEWHLNRENRLIFTSDGELVHQPRETSVSTIAQCEWWDRLLGEHNALAGIRRERRP